LTDELSREPKTVPDSFFSSDKTLSQWRYELRTLPRKHWNNFYREFLGVSISNYPLFYRALKMYDGSLIFDAILATARQEIIDDPLRYVLKVAHEMWKLEQQELDRSDVYEEEIKRAAEETKKRNLQLQNKLRKLRED